MNPGDTIVIADAHLDGVNAQLRCFVSLLESLRKQKIADLVLLGDIFNLWIGTSKMTLPCHSTVVRILTTLKEQGIRLIYIEGNRDYFLARQFLYAPFDVISSEGIQTEIAGKQWYFSHGDLVNIHDWSYRSWRRLSRNAWLFAIFNAMPQAMALRLANGIEAHLRGTNARYKSRFPAVECGEYAHSLWSQGIDMIVLGHFHQERSLERQIGEPTQKLCILPAWKDSHQFLRITPEGRMFLESSAATPDE